jgi:Na+-transporting methylmalonyl-CoA/oxaloacetate decarboxylase gamma subunit
LQVTAVGMVLVFFSLVLVAVLIWALDRIFRPNAVVQAAPAARTKPAPVAAQAAASAAPKTEGGLADQAAALAVALMRERQKVGQTYRPSVRAPMPWERPVSEDEAPSQGEIVTVITIDPGSGNWKSQGRLRAME